MVEPEETTNEADNTPPAPEPASEPDDHTIDDSFEFPDNVSLRKGYSDEDEPFFKGTK